MKSPAKAHIIPRGGPFIVAPSLWTTSNPGQVLTQEDRAMVAVVATMVRFGKGETIYEEGNQSHSVYNVVSGVAKSYRRQPDGRQHVVGFMFPGDVFGLTEGARYVNSVQAITALTAYKMPVAALEARLRKNPSLDFMVITKLCHELREAQHHAYLISRQSAASKLGLFLQMLETHQAGHHEPPPAEIYLPMSRKDVAAYVGISPEAVSRALRELATGGVISIRERQHIKIADRARLEAIVNGGGV